MKQHETIPIVYLCVNFFESPGLVINVELTISNEELILQTNVQNIGDREPNSRTSVYALHVFNLLSANPKKWFFECV